jgi:hypothetical protein
MAARLELKHGLVAEADRLATSADAALATEPATGSKVRTKGNLYLLVSAAAMGGRLREACALVADTIRREYYYDESAGIPICLEKALRSANRRLRGSRARLLMPEHGAAPGLPADDGLRMEVWRGEIAVGDSLLLVSRNVTSVVGTEELKNAVVTLHPQSAVEHLHHLFVAAGIPGGEQVAGAAAAVSGAFSGATGAVSHAVGGMVDKVMDLMPRRATSTRRITSQVSRAESQRRAAIALLALLAVILVLGLVVWVFPRASEDRIVNLPEGERAYLAAEEGFARAQRILTSDPAGSLAAFRQAWADVQRARVSVPEDKTRPLASQIQEALDDIYGTGHPRAEPLYVFDEQADPIALVRGPDRAAYFIDAQDRRVWRVDRTSDSSTDIARQGEGCRASSRPAAPTC